MSKKLKKDKKEVKTIANTEVAEIKEQDAEVITKEEIVNTQNDKEASDAQVELHVDVLKKVAQDRVLGKTTSVVSRWRGRRG